MTVLHNEDREIIGDCLSRLGNRGFSSAALDGIRPEAIGGAAVRLACRVILDGSGDYAHPLGFGRIQLTPWALDRPRVAVHVWDRIAMATASEDAHDHCYDFVSVCYLGGLEHRLFEVQQQPLTESRVHLLRYAAGSCNAVEIPSVRENLQALEIDRFRVEAPDIYSVACDIIHSAAPTNERTITIQFQSPVVKPHAQVYRPYRREGATQPAAPFSSERLSSVLLGLH